MQRTRPAHIELLCLALAAVTMAGCDAIEPVERDLLVLEAFMETNKPLAPVTIRRTQPLHSRYPFDASTAVADAQVVYRSDGGVVPFVPDPTRPGRYVPAVNGELQIPPRTRFSLEVDWQGERASAHSIVPPAIRIDRIDLDVPDRPIPAVFADSLSLNLREGFLYPVEVTISWITDFAETGADSAYWIRTRLTPPATFPSAVVGFFLRPEQIMRENRMHDLGNGRRRWVGVYGVPVETDTSRIPVHELEVALLRGTEDYAQYAASRHAPEQREPVSNVRGGVGIVAGVSFDRRKIVVGSDSE